MFINLTLELVSGSIYPSTIVAEPIIKAARPKTQSLSMEVWHRNKNALFSSKSLTCQRVQKQESKVEVGKLFRSMVVIRCVARLPIHWWFLWDLPPWWLWVESHVDTILFMASFLTQKLIKRPPNYASWVGKQILEEILASAHRKTSTTYLRRVLSMRWLSILAGPTLWGYHKVSTFKKQRS